MKTPKKKTPAAPPATTPSAARSARARASLIRFGEAYFMFLPVDLQSAVLAARARQQASEVPSVDLAPPAAAQPTPKLPRPGRRRARRGGAPGAGGGTGDGGESR